MNWENNDPRLALVGGDTKKATVLTGCVGAALDETLVGSHHITLGVGDPADPFEGMLILAEFHHAQN